MRGFIKHLSHSLLLIGILLAGFAGLVLFSYDKDAQFAVISLTSVAYVVWGVIHHLHNKDFHLEVLLEYLAVAILGFVVIFTLVIRA